jgi:hypothetical protein
MGFMVSVGEAFEYKLEGIKERGEALSRAV